MTLKDIATLAGVSTMTVSNVINGKYSRVSQETINKVNAIIEEHHYVPSQTARNLTAKSSKIIALIVPIGDDDGKEADQDHHVSLFGDAYVSSMLGSIEYTLRKNGYFPMIRSASKQTDILTLFRSWNVDGAIFLYPSFDHIIDDLITKISIPMVFIDSSSQNPAVMNVRCKNETGLYLATKYLISHGHTHIAFVADYQNNPLLSERFEGYRKALESSHIPLDSDLIYEFAPTYDGGIQAGNAIATSPKKISAVVTTADICAIGIMEGARLGGMRVPNDLSIIGFDDILPCMYTTPKLTSVSQHLHTKATMAANLLLEKLTTGSVKKPLIEIDTNIVERQSVLDIRTE